MNVNSLCDLIARQTGLPFSDLQLFSRRLRETGSMPQGAPGRAAPPVEPVHAAALVVALLTTDTARQAPNAINKYEPLLQRLTYTIRHRNEAQSFAGIHLWRSPPHISVVFWRQQPADLQIKESALEHFDYYRETLAPTGTGRPIGSNEIPQLQKNGSLFSVQASLYGALILEIHDAIYPEPVT
jgi:hypothetical protein